MTCCKLSFTITSDWHIGNGREGGAYADAIALKDANHLPFLPGRSVRGLLREAFQTAAKNNWFGQDSIHYIDCLFGKEHNDGSTAQGLLQITSAVLSEQDQQFLTQTEGATAQLYRVLHSTAIEHATGIAKETSLRSIEVVAPMALYAEIRLNQHHPLLDTNPEITDAFSGWLNQSVTLINELGAKRHRGFGQVTVKMEGA